MVSRSDPRLSVVFFELVDRVIEARGGWVGNKPVESIVDAVFDEVLVVANGHHTRLFTSALTRGLTPVVKH
jgi:hypothetical protein